MSKRQTRERILEAAGRVFAEQGYEGASVDRVMAEAGLTHGGFYAHFKNKADLFRQAMGHAVRSRASVRDRGLEGLTGERWLRGFAARYLSESHRRAVGGGCPVAALASELARKPASTRRSVEPALRAWRDELVERLEGAGAEASDAADRAWALQALCLGGLMLSRCMGRREEAEGVLAACRDAAERLVCSEEAEP